MVYLTVRASDRLAENRPEVTQSGWLGGQNPGTNFQLAEVRPEMTPTVFAGC